MTFMTLASIERLYPDYISLNFISVSCYMNLDYFVFISILGIVLVFFIASWPDYHA